jgi:hypothetical protein
MLTVAEMGLHACKKRGHVAKRVFVCVFVFVFVYVFVCAFVCVFSARFDARRCIGG